MPAFADRRPLSFASSSEPEPIRWGRRVNASPGVLDPASLDHAKDAEKVNVVASDVPPCVWATLDAARYFPINPQEWDVDYKAGVAFIEKSLKDVRGKWNLNWIHRNINGPVLADCVRKFPKYLKPGASKASYYWHFQNLCKAEQNRAAERKPLPWAYICGCVRMSVVAHSTTFEVLSNLRRNTIQRVIIALGLEPPTGRFARSERFTDERLQFLIQRFCAIGDVGLLAGLSSRTPARSLQVDPHVARSTPGAAHAAGWREADAARRTPTRAPEVARRAPEAVRGELREPNSGYRPAGNRAGGFTGEALAPGGYRDPELAREVARQADAHRPPDVVSGGFLHPPPTFAPPTTAATTSGQFVRAVDEPRPQVRRTDTVDPIMDYRDRGVADIEYRGWYRRMSPAEVEPAARAAVKASPYRTPPEPFEPVACDRLARRDEVAAPAKVAVGGMTQQDIADIVKSTLASSLKEITGRHPGVMAADGVEVSRMVQSILGDVTAVQRTGMPHGRERPSSPSAFANKRPRLGNAEIGPSSQRHDPYGLPPGAGDVYGTLPDNDRGLPPGTYQAHGPGFRDRRPHEILDSRRGLIHKEHLCDAPPDIIDRRSNDRADLQPRIGEPTYDPIDRLNPRHDDAYGQKFRRAVDFPPPHPSADPYPPPPSSARRAAYEKTQLGLDDLYQYPPRDNRPAAQSGALARTHEEPPQRSRSREPNARVEPPQRPRGRPAPRSLVRAAQDEAYPERPRPPQVRDPPPPQVNALRARGRERSYPPRGGGVRRMSPRPTGPPRSRTLRGSPPSRARRDNNYGHARSPPSPPRARATPAPAPAPYVSPVPILKLRSGGSRVADRRRSAPNARPLIKTNEDAFSVEYCAFAVGDGFEGKAGSPGTRAFSSAAFTQDLVVTATHFAVRQLSSYVADQGRSATLLPPVRILQQATNMVQSSGAAAVLLGVLNPLTGILNIGKLGDVGFVVLRPPREGSRIDHENDLEVVSDWKPYDPRDHARNFYGTLVTASNDLSDTVPVASWAHDTTSVDISLQPSDVVIAATDGFFDAVHIVGPKGAETRAFIRNACLEKQLDPGQLAEQLLLRAWRTVQDSKQLAFAQIDTPFCDQVVRAGVQDRFPFMPEDDIAVVVSYVLQQ